MESRFIAIGAISSTCRLSAYVSPLSVAHTSWASRARNISSQLSAFALSSVCPAKPDRIFVIHESDSVGFDSQSVHTQCIERQRESRSVLFVVSGEVTKTSVRLVVPSGAMKKLTVASSSIASCTWRFRWFRNSITSTVATRCFAATTVSFCEPALGLTSSSPSALSPKRGKVEKKVRSTSPISCSQVINFVRCLAGNRCQTLRREDDVDSDTHTATLRQHDTQSVQTDDFQCTFHCFYCL